jgi:hypothetical protein
MQSQSAPCRHCPCCWLPLLSFTDSAWWFIAYTCTAGQISRAKDCGCDELLRGILRDCEEWTVLEAYFEVARSVWYVNTSLIALRLSATTSCMRSSGRENEADQKQQARLSESRRMRFTSATPTSSTSSMARISISTRKDGTRVSEPRVVYSRLSTQGSISGVVQRCYPCKFCTSPTINPSYPGS